MRKFVAYPTDGRKCSPVYRGGAEKTKGLTANITMNIGAFNDKPRIMELYEKTSRTDCLR